MGQFSSTQKGAVGGVAGLIVLAILLYFFVFTSSEGLTQAVNPCADAEAGVWQKGKWHDGEVLFEEDAESEEVCAAWGEEWNNTNSANKVDLLTYDRIYKLCAGKKLRSRTYTAYKMITLGHCKDIETNRISTLSYNKQFDTVIANQGEFVTPTWTDITDDTAKMAATEGLDRNSTAADQCSRGTRWLHDENLIIPGETWMDCRGRGPKLCSGEGYGIGAFNPYPSATNNNDRAAIQIIKGDPEGVNPPDLSRRQNNDDYEGEDKTHLSVYLQCDINSVPDGAGGTFESDACTNADPPRDGMTNTRYNLVEVKQQPAHTGPISDASKNIFLGSYNNTNGNLTLKDTQPYRPPPGEDYPFEVGSASNDKTPSGCYVNLEHTTPYTNGSTLRTGSLRYNKNFEERRESRATTLRPKICQATETVTQVCEVDSEFSLLFL